MSKKVKIGIPIDKMPVDIELGEEKYKLSKTRRGGLILTKDAKKDEKKNKKKPFDN